MFNFFRSEVEGMKDRIIYTQKERIVKLEQELEATKGHVNDKHAEIAKIRENHDTIKERLIEQIVDLSDKFSTNHSKVMQIAEENARMKILLNQFEKSALPYRPKNAKAKKR